MLINEFKAYSLAHKLHTDYSRYLATTWYLVWHEAVVQGTAYRLAKDVYGRNVFFDIYAGGEMVFSISIAESDVITDTLYALLREIANPYFVGRSEAAFNILHEQIMQENNELYR